MPSIVIFLSQKAAADSNHSRTCVFSLASSETPKSLPPMSAGIPLSASHFLPSPIHIPGGRKPALPLRIPLPKLPPIARGSLFLGSGLRTPPVDDMSTAFQPALASYDNHAVHNYPVTMGRAKISTNESRNPQYYSYPSEQIQPRQAASSIQPLNAPFPAVPQATEFHLVKPLTPEASVTTSQQEVCSQRGSETLVYHSLDIPKCISPNRGNLADFAARVRNHQTAPTWGMEANSHPQMTCLFWFESTDELKQAESIRMRPLNASIPPLPSLAKPYDQFQKWVNNVLSTTQVTQNVILLALLFIYRLKMSTPAIKGRAGSEYRLLTVALMLGNKCKFFCWAS